MKDDIISTIKEIGRNADSEILENIEGKTSINQIYKHLVEKNHLISEDEYLENIYNLTKRDIIFKDGINYRLNNVNNIESILNSTIESNQKKYEHQNIEQHLTGEVSLIDMIKENMLQERLRDQEFIHFLKDQIKFYQSELHEKNKIIGALINKHAIAEVVETSPEKCIVLPPQKPIQYYQKNVNEHDTNKMNIKSHTKHAEIIQENNDQFTHPKIEIIGDSHLNPLKAKGLSKHNNVVVRNHPGANSEDIKSFIVPSIRKQRDVIIIHCGSNDIGTNTNVKDTIENLQSVINKVKKQSSHTKLAISSVFIRRDINGLDNKIKDLNTNLKLLCDDNLIDFISNDNITEKCLGIKKLHLSKSGTSLFARNLIEYIKKFN